MLRIWIGTLALALIAAMAAPAVFHAGHSADQDCAVCKLRDRPLADLSEELQARPAKAARRLSLTPRITLILPYRGARIPARAPPLSTRPA